MQPYSELFKAGQLIFAAGDAPDGAFLIESGRVEISTTHQGAQRVLSELGPGMLLGEMAVLDDSPRTATARALTDCRLIRIGAAQFAERLAAADPIVRALLMSQLARYRSALATLTGTLVDLHASPLARDADLGAIDKIRLESELGAALERRELELRLQPIQAIADRTIAGYEALVRWHHPGRGEVSPNEFIRLAEETSLILPVGDYILREVCDMLAELQRRGQQPLPFIALNVSARQLEAADLVARILAHLKERRLPPDRLKLEITESLVFDKLRVGKLLADCHAAGMHVALDDFGTGYSNLGLLLALDFDQIKIDASFVRDLPGARAEALIGAIATMARALECNIVAEGVETEAQYQVLRRLGCHYAQGWLIGRPIGLADVLASG